MRRFVLAGGKTSGAIVEALGVDGLRIGRSIDPGVPWTTSLDENPLALALKSGNFGSVDFFTKAFECLDDVNGRSGMSPEASFARRSLNLASCSPISASPMAAPAISACVG